MTLIKKLKSIFTEAHKLITSEEAVIESKKQQVFRVGSSGAIVGDKAYYTQCGRLAQARYLGKQTAPTENMRVMFAGGITLEDFIEKRLKTMNIPFSKEEEIHGEISPGIEVSGRPDYILWKGYEEVVGLEVKSLASPFSAIKLVKNKFPFMKHMIQSAVYMTLTGLNKWMVVVGHSFNVNDRGLKIDSQLHWYELTYINDKFHISNDRGESMQLPFDKYHLQKYYIEMDKGIKERKLMQRPTELELNVDTYNRCNYCPMKSSCSEYDNGQIDFEQWLERVGNENT